MMNTDSAHCSFSGLHLATCLQLAASSVGEWLAQNGLGCDAPALVHVVSQSAADQLVHVLMTVAGF